MTIRPATASDILRIVDQTEALRERINGPVPVDRPYTAAFLSKLMAHPDGLLLVSDGGFIAASLQPTPINPALVGMEHGWYATDRTGSALRAAYEKWADDRGAILKKLSTGMNGPDLGRAGYTPAEVAWVK